MDKRSSKSRCESISVSVLHTYLMDQYIRLIKCTYNRTHLTHIEHDCWCNLHPRFSTWPWAAFAVSHDKSIVWLYSGVCVFGGGHLELHAAAMHSAVQAVYLHEAAGAQPGPGKGEPEPGLLVLTVEKPWKPLEQVQLLMGMPGCFRTLTAAPQAGPTSTKPSRWWR